MHVAGGGACTLTAFGSVQADGPAVNLIVELAVGTQTELSDGMS